MASLHRWDPLRDVLALQAQMNRIFDDRLATAEGAETAVSTFSPPCDIYEDAEGVLLTIDLPGVDPKAVEVKVEDRVLLVTGERKLDREEKRSSYHRIERVHGTFLRRFSLPTSVDVERIKAENRNGVLRVFLPRREEQKPRKISVSVES